MPCSLACQVAIGGRHCCSPKGLRKGEKKIGGLGRIGDEKWVRARVRCIKRTSVRSFGLWRNSLAVFGFEPVTLWTRTDFVLPFLSPSSTDCPSKFCAQTGGRFICNPVSVLRCAHEWLNWSSHRIMTSRCKSVYPSRHLRQQCKRWEFSRVKILRAARECSCRKYQCPGQIVYLVALIVQCEKNNYASCYYSSINLFNNLLRKDVNSP